MQSSAQSPVPLRLLLRAGVNRGLFIKNMGQLIGTLNCIRANKRSANMRSAILHVIKI